MGQVTTFLQLPKVVPALMEALRLVGAIILALWMPVTVLLVAVSLLHRSVHPMNMRSYAVTLSVTLFDSVADPRLFRRFIATNHH